MNIIIIIENMQVKKMKKERTALNGEERTWCWWLRKRVETTKALRTERQRKFFKRREGERGGEN